jgi:DNA-binding Lrp family transcriptional regulator
VDPTDLKIVRLMGIQPFGDWPRDIDHLKPTHHARVLKLAPGTAKARVRRLEKEGVIAGYEIYPNWTQLGLFRASYLFRCPDARVKEKALPALDQLEGVIGVENFLGAEVGMEFCHRGPNELERRVKLTSKLLGDASAVGYVPFPSLPIRAALSRLDWRIIKALRHEANRPLPAVARELKVSARTVRRRVDRMWEEGSIDTVAKLDLARVANHIFCNFLIHFQGERDPETAKRFKLAFDPNWAYCWSPPDRSVANLVMGMVFRSPTEVSEMVRRMQAIEGVGRVEPLVSVSYTSNEAWIDDEIDQKIQTAPAETPPA